jgi:transcriptional regulator with XRE-family HTH domain
MLRTHDTSNSEVAMPDGETAPFGRGLRHWRRLRGVSQLDLASKAATTTRHLSFLETGRSRPSRQMVDRLGDALQIPLRERNRLLEMAGLAATYPQGDLTDDDLAPFQRAIDRLLASHEPYPGLVVDRHWNLVAANRGTERFLADTTERNTIRLVLGPWRPLIENFTEVARALLDRVGADLLRYPDDEELQDLHRQVQTELGGWPPTTASSSSRVICPRFRIDGSLVRTITVAARFESVADVTLDEVRVELLYPEDEPSERFFRALAGG